MARVLKNSGTSRIHPVVECGGGGHGEQEAVTKAAVPTDIGEKYESIWYRSDP